MGRPKKTFTEAELNKLVAMVRKGMTLKEIAKEHKVTTNTIWNWFHMNSEFEARIEKARVDAGLWHLEKATEIANDQSRDVLTCPVTQKIVLNSTAVQRDKMRVAQYNKLAAIADAKYSDRQRVDVNTTERYEGITIISPDGEVHGPPSWRHDKDKAKGGNGTGGDGSGGDEE